VAKSKEAHLMRVLKLLMALLGAFFVASQPVKAAWYKAETPKFIFYGTSAKDIQNDALRLERYDALLRTLTGIPETSNTMKLTVYVLPDIEAVRRAHGGPTSNRIGGFYSASRSGVIAVVPRSTANDGQEDVILFHEYAHHLMLQYFPVAYPAWYVEGFAEYLSTIQFTTDVAKIGLPARHRRFALTEQRKTPIEKLLSATVGDLGRDEMGNFYGRAWLLTHYLSFEPTRRGQQRAYLDKINEGVPALGAARQAMGDLDALQKDLDRYQAASKLSYLSVPNKAPNIQVTLTELDKATGDTLTERLALTRGANRERLEPIAERLRKLTTTYPGHPAVLTLLAEAELELKNFQAAGAAADAAIAKEPNNARALLWKGLSIGRPLFDAGDRDPAKWKIARSWIVRANRANIDDPLPLFEYYRTFTGERKLPPSSAITGLERAVELIPQSNSFRIPLAYEKTKAGDFKTAALLMRPIANSPHANAAAAWAKGLMVELNAAAAKPAGTVDINALMARVSPDRKEKEEDKEED
jgi:tetratricopeptide (TPR) repeat protein